MLGCLLLNGFPSAKDFEVAEQLQNESSRTFLCVEAFQFGGPLL